MGIFGFGKKKNEEQTPLDPQASAAGVENAMSEGSSLSDKVMEQQQWEESLRRFVKAEGERHHGSHSVEEKAVAGASDRESFFEDSAALSESAQGESVETEQTESAEPSPSEEKNEQAPAESAAETTAEDAIAKINSLLSSMHSSTAENESDGAESGSEEEDQKAQALRATELDLDALAAERNARLGISADEETEVSEEAVESTSAEQPDSAQSAEPVQAAVPAEETHAEEPGEELIEDSAAFTQAAVSAAEEAQEEDTTPTLAESDPLYQLLVLMRSYGHGQLTFDLRLLDSDMHYRLYHRGTQAEQGIVLPGIKFFEPVAALYTRAQRSSEPIWNRALIVASPDAQGHVAVQASYMSADGSDRTESFIFPGEESATEAARIQAENEEGPQTRQALGQAAVAAGLAPEPYPFEHDYDSDSGTEGQILPAETEQTEVTPADVAEAEESVSVEAAVIEPAAEAEEAAEELEAEDSTEAALAAIIAGADARLAGAEEASALSDEDTAEEVDTTESAELAASAEVETVVLESEEIQAPVAESEPESIDSLIVSELSEDDFAAEYPVEDLGASAEEETPLVKLDDITTPVEAEGSVRAPGLAQASAQLSQLTAPAAEEVAEEAEEAPQSDSELAAAYGVEELPAFLADEPEAEEPTVEESAAEEPAAETPANATQSESSKNAHSLFEDFSTPAASLREEEDEASEEAPATESTEKTRESEASEPALPASLADIAPEEEEDLLPPMQASTEGLQLAVGLNEMPPAVAEPDTPARSAQMPAPSDIELAEGNLVLTQAQVARHLAPVADALFGEHGTAKDATAVLIRVRALGSYYDALTHVRRGGFWEQVRTFDLVPEELLDIPGLKTASYSEGDGSPLAMSFSFTPGVPVQARFDYSNEQAFVSYPRALEAERSVEELRMFPRLGAKIPAHMAQALAHWNL